jgi:heptaprenylglyceryl phosphate synthase
MEKEEKGERMNIHAIKDIAFDIVVGASVLNTFLPPWDTDAIAQFPTVQKYYRLFVYITGYVAVNARSTVYKSISTNAGTKVSDVAAKANGTPQP